MAISGRRSRETDPERNAEIVRRRQEEHWTYSALAKEYGVSRQAIHEIVKLYGGSDAEVAREARRSNAKARRYRRAEAFDAEHGPAILAGLEAGQSVPEIAAQLTLADHRTGESDIRQSALRLGIPIAGQMPRAFSRGALILAIVGAAGGTSASEAEPELLEAIDGVAASAAEVHELRGRLEVHRNPVPLTKQGYERWRTAWIARWAKPEVAVWPPTSQTIIKRFGTWREATQAAGVPSGSQGRTPGLVVYTANDFDEAIADFFRHAHAADRPITVEEYESWAGDRPVPVSARIRDYYETWTGAKFRGRTLTGLAAVRKRRRRKPADERVDQAIRALDTVISGAESRLPSASQRAALDRAMKREIGRALIETVTIFEEFRREWLIDLIAARPQAYLARQSAPARSHQPTRADIHKALSRKVDDLLREDTGDVRSGGGWLGEADQAQLDRIDPRETPRWRTIKAFRNVVGHRVAHPAARLEAAISGLDPVADEPLRASIPRTRTLALHWLATRATPPAGYPKTDLCSTRFAQLHASVRRVAGAMRSAPVEAGELAVEKPNRE